MRKILTQPSKTYQNLFAIRVYLCRLEHNQAENRIHKHISIILESIRNCDSDMH